MTQAGLYDAEYFRRMRGSRAGDRELLYRKFLKLIGENGGLSGRILDAGCGRGELLDFLWRAGARDLWGVDFSAEAAKQTRSRLDERLGGDAERRIMIGSLEKSPLFPENHFDLIILTDVVEHLPPPVLSAALGNSRRWLKPGGRLFIHTFPTLGPHRMYQRYLAMRGRRADLDRLDAIHCNVQTRASLRDALERSGLAIERLWLENDLALTSSVFQSMSEGPLKTAAWTIFDRGFGSMPFGWIARLIGLEEYAKPSIYAVCLKTP